MLNGNNMQDVAYNTAKNHQNYGNILSNSSPFVKACANRKAKRAKVDVAKPDVIDFVPSSQNNPNNLNNFDATHPPKELFEELGAAPQTELEFSSKSSNSRNLSKQKGSKQEKKQNLPNSYADVDKSGKLHYQGHRKRLREKFIRSDGASFYDYEILEVILFSASPRQDVKPIAVNLLKEFKSLARVLSSTPQELLRVNGLGEAGVASIMAVRECASRLVKAGIEKKTVLENWDELINYCRATMSYNKTEQFRVFFLDNGYRLIADEKQQEGTIDHTPVYPREIVKKALEFAATKLILVHNHPSGNPKPSMADITMTKKIIQTAASLEIEIHDHIIIAGAEYFSFASNGML
jgi:DNA repair protein RadC